MVRVPASTSTRAHKTAWRRLIRFVTPEGETLLGEPIGAHPVCAARVLSTLDAWDPRAHVTTREARVARLLAPVEPRMILCIGLNYTQHAHETGKPLPAYPIVFAKNLAALQHPHAPVVLPAVALDPPEVDYEAELAFVIARACKDVGEADALDYVGGYMCANDISARRWQGGRGGGQWYVGKSFDTFCPLGPELVSPQETGDPQHLRVTMHLNGEQMQASSTQDMIFGVRHLVSFLSQGTTLLPGTVVLTGTPSGVGYTRTPPRYLRAGDEMVVEIERLGRLINRVEQDPRGPIRQDASAAKL